MGWPERVATTWSYEEEGGYFMRRDHESVAKMGLVGQGKAPVCLVNRLSAGTLGAGVTMWPTTCPYHGRA